MRKPIARSIQFVVCDRSRCSFPRVRVFRTTALRDTRLEPELLELAIECRTPDAELARHLGHLAAIVAGGEFQRLGLDHLHGPDVASCIEQRHGMRIAYRDDFAQGLA